MSCVEQAGAKLKGNRLKFSVPPSVVSEIVSSALAQEVPPEQATPMPSQMTFGGKSIVVQTSSSLTFL